MAEPFARTVAQGVILLLHRERRLPDPYLALDILQIFQKGGKNRDDNYYEPKGSEPPMKTPGCAIDVVAGQVLRISQPGKRGIWRFWFMDASRQTGSCQIES